MALKYLKPSFFIIGERKCGTSSMYRYLLDHPDILPCKVKEPQFFSKSAWYRLRHFGRYQSLFPPLGSTDELVMNWYVLSDSGRVDVEEVHYQRRSGGREITGEASANTFYDVPPVRLKTYYPGAKAILMLRDPVARAWSHYRMFLRFAEEGRRLPFKLSGFLEDALREIQRYRAGKRTYFIGQGVYTDHLTDWQSVFGADLAVVFAEEIEEEPGRSRVMSELTSLLGVEHHDFTSVMEKRYNVAGEDPMNPEAQGVLRDFYNSFDDRLFELLKSDLPWR